tara:strand:+ start:147 stop:1262 length:1116 start_codon:yes stop_codon:yes gene_type:complete
MVFSNDYTLRGLDLGSNNCSKILLLSILSLLGFSYGSKKISINDFINITKVENYLIKPFVIILLLFLILNHDLIVSSSTYQGNIKTSVNNSTYKYVLNFIFLCYSSISLYYYLSKKSFSLLLLMVMPLFLAGIYFNDKNPMVIGFVPLIFLLNKFKPYFILQLLIFVCFVFIIPIFVLKLSLYRGGNVQELSEYIKSSGFYKSTDARGPMKSLIITLKSKNLEFLYGKSYLMSFFQWIPKFVWPNRPLDLSQNFAIENMPDWKPGLGYGYSFLAESYKNFGFLGAFIQYYFTGYLLQLMSVINKYIFGNNILTSSISIIFIIFTIIIMNRGPFMIPTMYLRFIIPYLFIFYLTKLNGSFNCNSWLAKYRKV